MWDFFSKIHLDRISAAPKKIILKLASVHFGEQAESVFDDVKLTKMDICSVFTKW